MIVAGWDREGGAQVYGIPLGGTMLHLPFTLGGAPLSTRAPAHPWAPRHRAAPLGGRLPHRGTTLCASNSLSILKPFSLV